MIISIAWKNIWRNKFRSFVVLFAIAVGLVAGILSVAIMNGALRDRIKIAIKTEVGSIQLHRADFLNNAEPDKTMDNAGEIIKEIEENQDVIAVSGRLKLEAMINGGHGPRGAMVLGVNPDSEKKVSDLYSYIPDSLGGWFNTDLRNPIIISSRLAEKLKVGLNNKVQLDFVNKQGEAIAAIFRVCGIFKTNNSLYDEMKVFVENSTLQKILGFEENEFHQIVLLTKEDADLDSISTGLKRKYSAFSINSNTLQNLGNLKVDSAVIAYFTENQTESRLSYSFMQELLRESPVELSSQTQKDILRAFESGVSVMTWEDAAPEMALTSYWMDWLLYIFVGIILLALGFGIVNTMLMVVLERVKEFGMLMAIGMNRRRVYMMVVLETVFLSLAGGVTGIAISSILISWLSNSGINLVSLADGFNSMGYSTLIYPYIGFEDYIKIVIMVILTGVVSALYPAWKAIRLNPADAVRSE